MVNGELNGAVNTAVLFYGLLIISISDGLLEKHTVLLYLLSVCMRVCVCRLPICLFVCFYPGFLPKKDPGQLTKLKDNI